MKKLLLALVLGLTGIANATDPAAVVRSSYTTTNETNQVLLTTGGVSSIGAPGYLTGVIVSSAGLATGLLTIYGSSWTTTPIVAKISLGTLGQYFFQDVAVKGLNYTTANNSASGVTIIYKKQ